MMGGSGASRPPRTELDSFVIELVRAYPRAVISTDGGGRIPLTDAIYDWIEFLSKDTPLGVGGGMGVGGVGEDGMMGAGGGVDQDGNNAAGRFGDRPSNPSNLGMGSARGGSERLVSNVGSDRLEGMSELMGQNDNDPTQRRNTGDSTHTGRRSVLDNISLPSAFRSAYSSAGRIDHTQSQSRAAYRSNLDDDPAMKQQTEFRNVWSATEPLRLLWGRVSLWGRLWFLLCQRRFRNG